MKRLLERAHSIRILVVGDVMLDEYVSGHASRISPEAPVPVIAVAGRRSVPGGAANVAANVKSLGAAVTLGGVIGSDNAGIRLKAALANLGVDTSALVNDPERITTIKTRITAQGQQIVRFDEEVTGPLSATTSLRLRERCAQALQRTDGCVISDYAKGVMGADFCRWLIAEAVRLGKPVVVDPKSPDLLRYLGATVVTPNLKETAAAVSYPVHTTEELEHAAGDLMQRIAPSALLVTRGGDGMSLFEPGQSGWHLPAVVTEVSDVTGAGDTVVAMLAIGLALGYPLREAARYANLAAGLAVRHPGTWAVQPDELMEL